MKKLTAILLALSLTAVLGACGGDKETEPAPEETPATTESPAS